MSAKSTKELMSTKKRQPDLISWNLTSACNLRCPHCYLDAGQAGKHEMTTGECFDLIAEMSALGTGMLILTGGEPLLRRDVFSIAQRASQAGIMVVMGTNGILLDEELVITLKESGVSGVGISLDSLNPEQHDAFRGVAGCWEKTVRGIRTCIAAGLPVVLQTTLTASNRGEIPALMDFAHREGAQSFNLYHLVCTGRGESLSDVSPQQYEESLIYLVEAQSRYPGMMVRAKCAPHGNRIANQRGLPFLLGAGCPAGTSYLRIAPEGDVTPCPYLPLVAGNVRERSLRLIWEEATLFAGLRAPQLKGRCGSCEFGEDCIGCRARAWAATGDYLADDPWCEHQPDGGSRPPASAMRWTAGASEKLQHVPGFVRDRARTSIERYARAKGSDVVTAALVAEVRTAMGRR